MGWDRYVGRVGALAVALGIGSALAAVPAVAWAQPDDSPSAGASENPGPQSTKRVAKAANKPAPSVKSRDTTTSGAKRSAESTPVKKRASTAKHAVRASQRDGVKSDDRADDAADPVVSNAASTTATDDAAKPTRKSVVTSLFTPRAASHHDESSHHDGEPDTPAATPLLATMLAAARRHAEEYRAGTAVTAAASSSAQVSAAVDVDAGTEIRGAPQGPVVVGSTGTIYQVTSDEDGTRVSIIDSSGHVVTTSDAFAGTPFRSSTAVARPDGSVVVITTNDRRTRSTLWSVNGQGEVNKITTVVGTVSKPRVAADGSLYFGTNIPFIFSPIGNRDYRTVRVSSTNRVRMFVPDTSVTLAPDGSAYLVATQFGTQTLHAFGADGETRTILLPGGGGGPGPILGEDGFVYLPVGVRTLFGGKTTRVYTLRGADSTVALPCRACPDASS